MLIERIPAASEAHCVMTVNRGMNEVVEEVKGFLCKPDEATANPVWAFDTLRCFIKPDIDLPDPPHHRL